MHTFPEELTNGWLDSPPIAECPSCGAMHEDHDGLGVLYCDKCWYCEHPSASDSPLRCDICGRLVVIA